MVKGTQVALLSFVAVLAAGPVSAQGFEGVVTYQVNGNGGQIMEMALTVKGGKLRTDMNGGGHQMAMILDVDAGKTTMIMPEQKMYMTHDITQFHPADSTPPKITPLGTTETIAGHTCDDFLAVDSKGEKTQFCNAKGLGFFMMPRGPMGRGPASDVAALNAPSFRQYFKDGFFPLRVSNPDTKKVMMEATKIEPKSIDASTFEVPAGFMEMKMPNMGPRP